MRRLVVFALLSAALVVSGPVLLPAWGDTLRVGVSALPTELDPATALEGPVPLIARQVFDTLVQYTETSDVEPALSTQWSISKDALVWTFRLRPGVRFHDGTPLSAQEVVESLQREIFPGHPQAPAGDPIVGRLLRGAPGVIREVRVKGPLTVEIVLSQPYAPLLTVLAHPAFSIVLPAPAGSSNRWQGTGPFAVVEIGAGRIALDASPAYWGRRPRLARIEFLEVADEARADAALAGQILDVVFPASAPSRPSGAVSIPGWRVGYVALETEKEPFRRVKARQAVAAALDPTLIAGAVGAAAAPLTAFLPRGVWARREAPPLMGADPERARRLLAEAGFGASPVTLLVADTGGRLDPLRLAEAIRGSLGAAGLSVTVKAAPPDVALASMQAGDSQLSLAEARVEAGDPHFLLYPLSASEGATKGAAAVNFSFYRNQRLDDLLIRASQLSFRPERERLYVRAQAMLAEELPWIPIYARLLWAVARPEVKGLRLHPSGCHRLDRVWLESAAPTASPTQPTPPPLVPPPSPLVPPPPTPR